MKTYAILLTSLLWSSFGFAVIFDKDNRIEAQTQATPFWAQKAKSVAALIPHEFIRLNSKGSYSLKGLPLRGKRLGFCPQARFSQQELIANCTGSLISEKHILTAAHCLDLDSSRKRGCSDYKIAFDYAATADGTAPQELRASQVYQCEKIIYRKFDIENFTEDLAVIELDRKVTGRRPVELNFNAPQMGTPLAMIGHPLGIPQKFTDDAEVLAVDESKVSFRHNLDTFSVNSGGPIFDAHTGEQVGVLVRGTGMNKEQLPQQECFDWSRAKDTDFAEGNDLSRLEELLSH